MSRNQVLETNGSLTFGSVFNGYAERIRNNLINQYAKVLLQNSLSREKLDSKDKSGETNLRYGDPTRIHIELPNRSLRDLWQRAVKIKASYRTDICSEKAGGYTIESSKQVIREFDTATIFGPYGLIRTQNHALPLEVVGNIDRLFENRLVSTIQELGFKDTWNAVRGNAERTISSGDILGRPVISMITTHGDCYSHWLLDDLPRLRAAKRFEEAKGPKPTLLLDSDLPDWMFQTLEMLGFHEEDWIFRERDIETIQHLLLPTYQPIRLFESEPSPSNYRWVSEQMKRGSDWKNHQGEYSDRVFISRAGSEYRHIVNREDVTTMLSRYGFEIYRPEQMKLEEQIALFEGANLIVGPMGGAFANLIYAEDATLLEILPPQHVHLTWLEVTSSLGLEYDYVAGNPSGDAPSLPADPSLEDFYETRDRDILVDVEELRERIERHI